tara:strand:+ start:580 stop:828 length:249 start_codon:yes stop_codon:yes gene_type:complete
MINLDFEPPTNQQEALYQGFCLFFTAPSKKHQQGVLNLIFLILADPEVSQEMVQKCFERAFRFLNSKMQMQLDKKNTPSDHP